MTQAERMATIERAASGLLADVERATVAWHPGSATLTRALARQAPHQGSAVSVIASLGAHYTSVLSRLARAGLPSPKEQLSAFRLSLCLRLSRRFPLVSEIAYQLDYSSPQSFGRHVRQRTGLTGLEFFGRWTPEGFWQQVSDLMRWDSEVWARVDSLKSEPDSLAVKAVSVTRVAERLRLVLGYGWKVTP